MARANLVGLGDGGWCALGRKGEKRSEGKREEGKGLALPAGRSGGTNEIAHLLESATQEGGRYYTNLTYQLEQEPQRCESCLLPAGRVR